MSRHGRDRECLKKKENLVKKKKKKRKKNTLQVLEEPFTWSSNMSEDLL